MRHVIRPALLVAFAFLLIAAGVVVVTQLPDRTPDDPWAAAAVPPVDGAGRDAGAVGAGPGAPVPAGLRLSSRSGDLVDPGRLIVRFESAADPATRARALAAVGAVADTNDGDLVVAELPEDADLSEAIRTLGEQPGVAFAEPDALRTLHGCDDCWQLGEAPGVNAAPLHAEGVTGEGTVVALLDDGVDPGSVPDLQDRVLGLRTCTSTGCTDTTTGRAHGTMVASIIVARDDGQGITGVAPAARIKSWNVSRPAADGKVSIPSSHVVRALEEIATDPEVDVVNASFGNPVFSRAENEAFQAVLAAGKTVVASAGNDGTYLPVYPAAYEGVIGVGALDRDGEVPRFSSYGHVDLVAPGVCVPVSAPSGAASSSGCPKAGDGIAQVSGTSFAAPAVAGVLALRQAGTPLRDQLGLAGTAAGADGRSPDETKRRGHGLVDAQAWERSFEADADPYLVLRTDNPIPRVGDDVEVTAYLLRSDGTPVRADAPVRLGGQSLPLDEITPGILAATGTTGALDTPGARLVTARADRVSLPVSVPDTDADAAGSPSPAPAAPAPPSSTAAPAAFSEGPVIRLVQSTGDGTTPPAGDGEATGPDPEETEVPTRRGAPGGRSSETDPDPAPPTTQIQGEESGATPSPSTAPTPTPTPSPRESGDGASATTDTGFSAQAALRVLRPDDQAPGVAFFDEDAARPWLRSDTLQGGARGAIADDDPDDVYSVHLEPGDVVEATVRPPEGETFGLSLFAPGITDIYRQMNDAVDHDLPRDQNGAPKPGTPAEVSFTATKAGTYLVNVYALGLESKAPSAGAYELDVRVRPGQDAPSPLSLGFAACSPNGDGVRDVCTWSVNADAAVSVVSAGNGTTLASSTGTGSRSWDGRDAGGELQADGAYRLDVAAFGAGGVQGRVLTPQATLRLDRVAPQVRNLRADPNPFRPAPVDGDRDTTNIRFDVDETVTVRGRVYEGPRPRSFLFFSGSHGAGQVSLPWNGGGLPPGSYEYVLTVTDEAGNSVVLPPAPVRIAAP